MKRTIVDQGRVVDGDGCDGCDEVRRLEAIGFWFDPHAPSARPRPQALVGRWSPVRRAAVIAYLRAGATFERYRAGTFCRFGCGVAAERLGRRDLFDGVWLWPEGLAHYVEAHDVRLPERFVRHALRRGVGAPAPRRPRRREGLIDERGWVAWGRSRGAVPALEGWELPDFRERESFERGVGGTSGVASGRSRGHGELVLVRRDRRGLVRDAVLDVAGALAVVSFAPISRRATRPPTVEVLAGWDAWPRA